MSEDKSWHESILAELRSINEKLDNLLGPPSHVRAVLMKDAPTVQEIEAARLFEKDFNRYLQGLQGKKETDE